VDNFKLYNDTYGHVSGDSVLKQIASTIERCLGQSGDLAARFGGEEFAVVMPATSPGAARLLGEKIRLAVEALRLRHAHSSTGNHTVTISIGGASIVPAPGLPTTLLMPAGTRFRAPTGRSRRSAPCLPRPE
ncbi:diguanylate cyclase, partial [Burkholderia cenocepacia]|nr:diguanylate cyclase [Burkholderia cenocepacia]MDR5670682.1 diguanylate cyclase [Burkholderia cenocepacia]